MMFLSIIIGLGLLYFGAKFIVFGASNLARTLGVSQFTIGLTVVAIGTSLPELMTTVYSNIMLNNTDVVFANIIGSNIANIGLALSLALFFTNIKFGNKVEKIEVLTFFISVIVLLIFIIIGTISRYSALLLLLLFFVYLLWQYYHYKVLKKEKEVSQEPILKNFFMVLLGGSFLFYGGKLLIYGVLMVSYYFDIPIKFMGITVLALGTSLPEIAVSILAACNKKPSILIGNIVGSSIFNVLFVLGVAALIKPVNIAKNVFVFDGYVLLIYSLLLTYFILCCKKINFIMGVIMLLFYFAYIYWSFVF